MNRDIRWKQRFANFDRGFVLLRGALERGPETLSMLEKEGVIQRFEYTFELVLDCKNKRYNRQAIWAAGAARARSIPAAGCDEIATKPAAQRANG